MKRCTGCQLEKPFGLFHKRSGTRDGLDLYCKECKARDNRISNIINRKHVAQYRREYYQQHQEDLKTYAANYRKEHLEQFAAKNRAIYLRDREQRLAYNRDTREKRRDVIRAGNNRRRALKQGALINDFTASQWRAMQRAYDYRCAYCGVTPGKLTQDHIHPLSRGGNHTANNIVPACMDCNNRKKTKDAPPFVVRPHPHPPTGEPSPESE